MCSMRIKSLLLILIMSLCAYHACCGQISCLDSANLNLTFKSSIKELNLNGKRIVLLGEMHGVSITNSLFYALIQSFVEKNGCSIICERSYSEALLYNNFLESGNQEYLKFDVAWSVEMRDFFISLYEYNQGLPQKERLRFIGIDAVHSKNAFIMGIQKLLPSKQPPTEIFPFVDSLRRLTLPVSFNNSKAKNYFALLDELLDYFKKEITAHHALYREFFAENFLHVEAIINSKSTYSNPGKRDVEMFNNLIYIIDHQKVQTSLIGLFGNTHVMKLKSSQKSFGEMVGTSETSPFKGRALRILIQYENSKADFQGKIVTVPSVLSSMLGKKELTYKAKLMSKLTCRDFIFKPQQDEFELNANCDYLIFVSDKQAVHQF